MTSATVRNAGDRRVFAVTTETKVTRIPRGPATVRPQCGSKGGYQKHHRSNEYPCDLCLKVHSEEVRALRIRKGQAKSIELPVELMAEIINASSIVSNILKAKLGIPIFKALVGSPPARCACTCGCETTVIDQVMCTYCAYGRCTK